MKTKTALFLIIIFLITGCYKKIKTNLDFDYYKQGIYFLEHTENFEKKYNLILHDYGVNCNKTMYTPSWNNIHHFRITFYSIENLNLYEVRKKIVNCIEKYLELINSNSALKSYLYKYPFTQKELLFSILFYKKNGKRVEKNFISMCYLDNEMIYYFNTPEYESFKLIHKETYEEALNETNLSQNSKITN